MMCRPISKAKRCEAGFTLLELIVVIAIIALAVTLGLPAAERTRQGFNLRSATVDVASAINTVRAEAIRANTDAEFTIDVIQQRFSGDGLARPRNLPTGVAVRVDVPAGEQVGEGRAVVRFRPDGTSSGARITLRQHTQSARVSVDWLTGRTRIVWGL